jgi:hypothetical protein
MLRCRSVQLSRYGDLTGRSWGRWRGLAQEAADDRELVPDGDELGPESGMWGVREGRFWPLKAKPSAIGGNRRRADVSWPQPMAVVKLPLARWAEHESVRRE